MLVDFLVMLAITIILIGFNALYVAGEFAAVSSRKSRIEQMASEGNRLAKTILPVLSNSHRLDNYIAASQVGITISSVVLGIYGQQQIAPFIAPLLSSVPFIGEVAAAGVSATLVLIFLTTLQVILGELVPKTLALRYPERVALGTAIPMRWSADIILRPLIIILNGSGNVIMRLMGIHHEEGHKHVHSPEEIKYLILQSHEGGLLDEQEHRLLDSALRFGKFRAGDIVMPRTKMVAVDISTPCDDILQKAAEADFTRIPIYENDIDHIIGFIHLKELFQLSYKGEGQDIRPILRDVTFIPETAYLDDVWDTLNEQQSYLAIVLDEYGGTVGMLTREDLIEELFGEVQDEFDPSAENPIRKLDDHRYCVRGEVSVAFINDRLGLNLETENAFTIGGLFLNELGHMPKLNEVVKLKGVELKATTLDDKAVEEIELTLEQAVFDDEDA